MKVLVEATQEKDLPVTGEKTSESRDCVCSPSCTPGTQTASSRHVAEAQETVVE